MDPAPQTPGSPEAGAAPGGHGRAIGREGERLGDDEVWERVSDAGIRMLRIPTPFAVGRVNCYLLEDEPLTLIDTGPNSGKALDELERQLGAVGRSVEELERIIVSHQHIDHMGLVQILADRSGAEVVAIGILAPFLANYSADAERDDEYASGLMHRHGIPDEIEMALRSVSRSFRAWGSAATVTRELSDGETLEFRDRSLEVRLRPGHSPSDTVFWDADRKLLLAADHLIAHISSNPLMARPLDGSEQRPKALLNYIESMRQTRELDAEIVLSGHGEPISDHVGLIDSRLRMHDRRAEKLRGLLADGPRTAYELAHDLWGNVAVTQAFLTLSEVVGHMDLLIERGQVVEAPEGDVVRFAATGGARAASA